MAGARTGGVALVLALLPTLAGAGADSSEQSSADLTIALERLDRVAQLYRDTALRFTCREMIEERLRGSSTSESFEFDYVYVYDDREGLKDYRLRLGPGPRREVRLQDLPIGQFLERAYSWAFLFRSAVRRHFRYEMGEPETVLGREALRIEFRPLPPYQHGVNDWAGTAWIDARTYQILRVEALPPEEFEVRRQFREQLVPVASTIRPREQRRYIFGQIITDFSVERNGMRFPGRVEIVRSAWTPLSGRPQNRARETPILHVEQSYSDYRFFAVHSEAEIHGLVFEGRAPPPSP